MATTPEIARLWSSLEPGAAAMVRGAMEQSREDGIPLHLVGGAVRDLLLGRPFPDLDLVVEGDALAFGRRLARRQGGEAELHPEFLTATVRGPGGAVLDLATSRREVYSEPGALPRVEPAPLAEDLGRRDFSLNAIALRLGPDAAGRLEDPLGGRADLAARRLRVLHAASFHDDPTRILRGLVLAARLDLVWEEESERLAAAALSAGALATLSRERLRPVLRPLLELAFHRPDLVLRFEAIGLARALHPRLRLDPPVASRIESWASTRRRLQQLVGGFSPSGARLAWAAATWELDDAGRGETAAIWAAGERQRSALAEMPRRVATAAAALTRPQIAPHRAAALLRPLDDDDLVALAAEGGEAVAGWVAQELTRFRRFELSIGGDELLALGFPAGPGVGRALETIRDARLDGVIGRGEELAFALTLLRAEAAPERR